MKYFCNKKNRGFTLIELMVSISIFSVIMVISMGAVLSIVEANRKSRTLKSSMNNLNLVIESVARNIKFGTNWSVTGGTDCAGGIGINFIDKFSIPTVTRHVFYQCVVSSGIGRIERKIDIVGGASGTYESITSPEIDIEHLTFVHSGLPLGDNLQPFLIMSIGGVAGTKVSNQTSFNLQTAISQRQFPE